MAAVDGGPSTSGRRDPTEPLLSVAPMMDWTDVHYRQMARLISRRTWLWTEMVVDKTILHSHLLDKWLWLPPEQRPCVLQLGGSDPDTLRAAARVAARYGYDEINLNCGCPSDRVAGAGCFGAAMMLTPSLVADCMRAVREGAELAAADAAAEAAGAAGGGPQGGRAPPLAPPRVSVKCRIGVDDEDSYGQLAAFVAEVAERGGVEHFVVHARKCLLRGLSPAQNRSVPPLRHDWVWALARDFPSLRFHLNGGVLAAATAAEALALEDASLGVAPGALAGVMIGRAAYNDPWSVLGDADVAVFGEPANPAASRRQVVERYCEYADAMLGRWQVKADGHCDPNVRTLVRPLLNLFHGDRGGKRWKAKVDEVLRLDKPRTLSELMRQTLHIIDDEVLDAPPRPAAEAAAVAGPSGTELPPFSLGVERLAAPGDRARGERERRRRGGGDGGVQQQQPQQGQEQQQAVVAAVGA